MPGVEIDRPHVVCGFSPPVATDTIDEDQPLVDRVTDHGGKNDVQIVLQGGGGLEAVVPGQGAGVEPADILSGRLDVDGVRGGSVNPVAGPPQVGYRGLSGEQGCLAGAGVDELGHLIG